MIKAVITLCFILGLGLSVFGAETCHTFLKSHAELIAQVRDEGFENYWIDFESRNRMRIERKDLWSAEALVADELLRNELKLPLELALLAALELIDLPLHRSPVDFVPYVHLKLRTHPELSASISQLLQAALLSQERDTARIRTIAFLKSSSSPQAQELLKMVK